MNTTKDEVRQGSGSAVSVTDSQIVIRIDRPAVGGSGVDGSGVGGSDLAGALVFAARADSYQGLILWHRYEAIYALYRSNVAAAEADSSADAFTRVYDPACRAAASYAVAAGVRQGSGEVFVDRAVACVERIPALGHLMRRGVITVGWFHRAIELTALVDDPELLARIDAEAAVRIEQLGGLSAARVESTISAVVAEHDPEGVVLTREEVKARKDVTVAPVTAQVSEVRVTAATEDVQLVRDTLDAVIAGVCQGDRRSRGQLRSDAAIAALTGRPFTCLCDSPQCEATLAPEDIAERCAQIVVHVVVRKDTLTGASETPAYLDGMGSISAAHVREIATRPDAHVREVDVDEVIAGASQPSNSYRPTTACDTLVRALFGQCTTAGCDRRAWRCDLDHVAEFNHEDPAAGGPTCWCNLSPKCRFHHNLKTFATGWLDDQVVDANGQIWTEVTTPEGVTVRSQALNSWLVPELGQVTCDHGGATRPGVRHAGQEPIRRRSRTDAKHRYRMQQRAANRRRRAADPALAVPVSVGVSGVSFDDDSEPPF